MTNGIAHDLSRKIQQQLGDVLIRETAIAQHACSLPEIALMLIEAAVMMARTAAGTIANSIDDEAEAERMINYTTEAIIQQIRVSEGSILAKVLADRADRAA